MKISRLWIVTKPTKNSTLDDICFQTDLKEGLCRQYKGGLDPKDIVGFWDDESQAKNEAEYLIRMIQKELE